MNIRVLTDVYGFLFFPILLDLIDVLVLVLFFEHLLIFVVIEYVIIEDFEDVFEAAVGQSKE